MTSPDDTAPHGGATHTLGVHTLVDVGEMILRTRDDMHETKGGMYEMKGVLLRHDAQLAEMMPLVKAAVVPQARAIRWAAVAGAGALVVIAVAFVAIALRSSSASAAAVSHVETTAQK